VYASLNLWYIPFKHAGETWALLATDTRSLESFHMK